MKSLAARKGNLPSRCLEQEGPQQDFSCVRRPVCLQDPPAAGTLPGAKTEMLDPSSPLLSVSYFQGLLRSLIAPAVLGNGESQEVISFRRLLVVEVHRLSHRYHLGWLSLGYGDHLTISRPQTIFFYCRKLGSNVNFSSRQS